jgi:diguanylate cyclase (GGDEF)-like protein/PAS domain S-box-containing protein
MISKDEFYQAILENIGDGAYMCDLDRRITYWSPGAERITGYTSEQVRGSACHDGILMHVDEEGNSLCKDGCPLQAAMTDGKAREASVYLHHKNGHRVPVVVKTSPIHNAAGEIEGAVEVFSDNSTLLAALKRVRELSVETETDPLTEVGNRRSMEAEIEACVNERRRAEASSGVLFVDIDHFKNVNDTFGHEIGDRVLKMVAKTLQHNLRASDSLARWGGEEFLVLLRYVDAKSFAAIAEKLRMLVAESYLVTEDGSELRVTISIGGTLVRASDTRNTLIGRADRLLYESKSKGRNMVTWSA